MELETISGWLDKDQYKEDLIMTALKEAVLPARYTSVISTGFCWNGAATEWGQWIKRRNIHNGSGNLDNIREETVSKAE